MKAIRWIFWGCVALILISFAIANRHTVFVSLDPLDAENPLLGMDVPLFAPVFIGILAGMLVGGMATWLRQGKYRSAARQQGRALDRLEQGRGTEKVEGVATAETSAPSGSGDLPPIQPGRKLSQGQAALEHRSQEAKADDERAA